MMDFVINGKELAAMSGLPHIQQLAYLRGIRPYMDVKTGITGIKRRISYQSISEHLYIEPHQGIKSQSFSRDQVRRAVSGLKRAGVIEVQSDGMQLVLKCPLATRHFSVQNKAATPLKEDDYIYIFLGGSNAFGECTPRRNPVIVLLKHSNKLIQMNIY